MGNLNDEEYMKLVGAEVCEILKNIPKEDYYKVPKSITSLFETFENEKIVKKLDLSKGLKNQEITQEAKDIIFLISLNYWLTPKEKEEVVQKMKINEKELSEKYNPDNLFKLKQNENKNQNENQNEELNKQEEQSIEIQKKENIFKKFIKFLIEKIFKKE